MSEGYYCLAKICKNGHVISSEIESNNQYSEKFCSECGSETIMSCQHCNEGIRGSYYVPTRSWVNNTTVKSFSEYKLPNFCYHCGKPFPWTESRLQSARELTDELDSLDRNDKDRLKASLDDLVRDTPQTTLAATRFKNIMLKVGKETAGVFKSILINVLSEAAKKSIGWS